MASTKPSIPAPPSPPAPAVSAPAAAATGSAPAEPPAPPAPPPPEPVPAGADNTNEAQPGTSGQQTAPLTGVGEIDGGAPEKSSSDEVDTAAADEERKRQLAAASPNGAVTRNAEAAGAAKASDYKPRDPDVDDEFAEVPEDKFGKRTTKISHSAFKAGRRGTKLGKQRKSMTDAEWSVYQASYQRGVQQGEADELSGEDRLARIERALGLMIPGAPDPFDEDDE